MSSNFKIRKIHRISGILLALMLSACLILSVALSVSAETTSNEAVNSVASSVFQIRTLYTLDDGETYCIQYGSSFLINENTVLTAAHVVNIDETDADISDFFKKINVKKIDEKKISYEVVVRDDVTIPCKIETQSEINDFAVITLNKTINNRSLAALGDSDNLNKTQDVYSLGFPGVVTATTDRNTYTSEDVTITASKIQNLVKHGTEDYILHGATLSGGQSGGPLVDEYGVVIGLNTQKYNEDEYFRAVSINQVKAVLSDLGIEYADTPTSSVSGNDVEKTTTIEETTEVTEATTKIVPAPIEPTTGNNVENKSDTIKTIIVAAIIALIIIIIIVVVIILISSKKKSANKIQTPTRGTTVMPGSVPQSPQTPSVNRSSQPPYAQSYNRPSVPQQGAAPTMPSNEGSTETSVLNDGAGETTVLGNQSTGYVIVRKRNNEKIIINKPEFVIGKERRRVDYCINDNNSVSRAHAKIKVRAGRCYISDLGSTNYTYVNGSKLSPNQEIILSKGDKIKISDEEFEFLG